MTVMTFNCVTRAGESLRDFVIQDVVIAGWTGRDRDAVESHIIELEELGVKRPATVPCYYFVSDDRLTQQAHIQVVGSDSSGEIEFFLLNDGEYLWVGIGSDHTDRKVETYDITVSKQICAKPVSRTIWPLDEVREHWDQLELHAWREDDQGQQVPYQQGRVSAMLPPDDLIDRFCTTYGATFDKGTLMFCGTLAAIGGIQPSREMVLELKDPVLQRDITFHYAVVDISR